MSAPPSRPSVEPPSPPSERPRASLPAASDWLVDGYNVLHWALMGGEAREETGWWQESSRSLLLARARNFDPRLGQAGREEADADPCSVWIVFDGPRPSTAGAREGLQIVFAPSADQWIVRRVRQAPEPEALAVVSADRQLAERCRHAGAAVVSPKDFIAHCGVEPA